MHTSCSTMKILNAPCTTGRYFEKEEEMANRITVGSGDSLWSLACRYLDGGERYPQIHEFHNREAARYGLRPIEHPNLIYVGQTILIPPRPKLPKPGNGTKAEGGRWPVPLALKVTYTIGRDTPPVIYTASYGDYTIKTELSGEIGIENVTPGDYKYVHTYELAMSKDPLKAKQKLHGSYDRALSALIAKPEVVYESGKVKIKAPIATKANLGPYTIELKAFTPFHMSGKLKPQTIKGSLALGRSRYKYSAKIEFEIDVIWHQRPKDRPEMVKSTEPVRKVVPVKNPNPHTSLWDQTVNEKGVAMAMVLVVFTSAALILYRIATKGVLQPSTLMTPFTHTIDPRDTRA